jgi:plasmid stabilization system protein ParE
MTYRIQMTRQAADDVDAIYEYIARRSISGADSWYEAFYEARKDLTSEPEKFALSTANEFFPGELREHFFRTRYGR